jgi:hypothetical protein
LTVALFSLTVSALSVAAEKTITVPPGQSLEAARDAARAWRQKHAGDRVTIRLLPVRHELSAPLQLRGEDGGTTWTGAGA